jgi:hypothetical protein
MRKAGREPIAIAAANQLKRKQIRRKHEYRPLVHW